MPLRTKRLRLHTTAAFEGKTVSVSSAQLDGAQANASAKGTIGTDGAMKLGPGTLYAAIRRLEDQGLVEESPWRPDADLDDARRRYYRLTKTGRAALEAETDRLHATVKLALKHLKMRPAR